MKHHIKRIITFLAALSLIPALVLPRPVHAAPDIRSEIRAGMTEGQEQIDLSAYDISYPELEALLEEMKVLGEWPWYVEGYSCTYYTLGQRVSELSPEYSCDSREREAAEAELERMLREAVLPDMAPWQIALSLHDLLAERTMYDESQSSCTAYDLLTEGTSVCEGYSRIYQELLGRAGVESVLCSSDAMDHVWNMVRLGDGWYHVDVTWDDPVPDVSGRVEHTYFLLSDEQISDPDHGHYGWQSPRRAEDSETMAEGFWREIRSRICYRSAQVSFFRQTCEDSTQILRRDEETGAVTVLDTMEDRPVDAGTGPILFEQYGLSLHQDTLYYAGPDCILAIRTDGTDRQVVHRQDVVREGRFILGMSVSGDALRLTLSDPSFRLQSQLLPLDELSAEPLHDDHTTERPPAADTVEPEGRKKSILLWLPISAVPAAAVLVRRSSHRRRRSSAPAIQELDSGFDF